MRWSKCELRVDSTSRRRRRWRLKWNWKFDHLHGRTLSHLLKRGLHVLNSSLELDIPHYSWSPCLWFYDWIDFISTIYCFLWWCWISERLTIYRQCFYFLSIFGLCGEHQSGASPSLYPLAEVLKKSSLQILFKKDSCTLRPECKSCILSSRCYTLFMGNALFFTGLQAFQCSTDKNPWLFIILIFFFPVQKLACQIVMFSVAHWLT